MTQVLQQAFDSLQKLPEAQQHEIALRLLEEIEEAKWQASFSSTESKAFLQAMSDKVRAERRAGQTLPVECE